MKHSVQTYCCIMKKQRDQWIVLSVRVDDICGTGIPFIAARNL